MLRVLGWKLIRRMTLKKKEPAEDLDACRTVLITPVIICYTRQAPVLFYRSTLIPCDRSQRLGVVVYVLPSEQDWTPDDHATVKGVVEDNRGGRQVDSDRA